MKRMMCLVCCLLMVSLSQAKDDKGAIVRAVKDYIESQHQVNPEMMQRGLHPGLVKRTFWKGKDGKEHLMSSDFDSMVALAGSYNKHGDKFPAQPKVRITVFDIDQRVASVKLDVDDWIDYMHLMKTQKGEWKVVNVLWQFHDTERHQSK